MAYRQLTAGVVSALPAPLQGTGPLHVVWWQWVALLALIPACVLAGRALGAISVWVLQRVAGRTRTVDVALPAKLTGPISALWGLSLIALALPYLDLSSHPHALSAGLERTGFLVILFWGLACMVDVASNALSSMPWSKEHPASLALIPIGARLSKILVVVLGVLSLLSDFGYPVGSLVAGLGIGGLAFALAAQKTVEHLFGGVSLGLDQPLRVGDAVKIDDFSGTVESIGIRSTRIRTPDRTLITLPNGTLAEKRIETLAARDRIRLSINVGLPYGTAVAQLRQVLADLEDALRAHPKVWSDNVIVRFSGLGESALEITVMAWFLCEWDEFMVIRQEMLLQFMEIVEQQGISFALPSRRLYLVGDRATAT